MVATVLGRVIKGSEMISCRVSTIKSTIPGSGHGEEKFTYEMTVRHEPGSLGITATLVLPGLPVMAAPRDREVKVDRSTQLHRSWDHGPMVAFRVEFLEALSSNKK
jgi:hypothetical protein